LNEWQLQTLARQHGIRKDRGTYMLDKLFTAFLRRADEGTLSRLLVEAANSCFTLRAIASVSTL
jgi:ParB family transcriptional regulator, chromosome partitioning protein